MLRRLLRRIADQRELREFEAKNPTAAKMRRLVPKCLVCSGGPMAHHYAKIASMPCNEVTKPRVASLFRHVQNHEWERLKDCREFRADQDDAIAYAITGPHEGGMVILIRDPAELFARVEVYLEETVTAEEAERIKSLVPYAEWHEL